MRLGPWGTAWGRGCAISGPAKARLRPPPAPSGAPVLSQGAPSGAPGAPLGRALGARLRHASVGPGTAKARLRVLGCACAIPGRTPEGQMCALGVRLCAHAGVSPDTANSQGAPSLPRVRLRYPRAHPAKLQVHLGGAPVPCRCGPWHSQGAPSLPRVRLRYPRVHPVELQARLGGAPWGRTLGARLGGAPVPSQGAPWRGLSAAQGAPRGCEPCPARTLYDYSSTLCAPVGRGTKPLVRGAGSGC